MDEREETIDDVRKELAATMDALALALQWARDAEREGRENMPERIAVPAICGFAFDSYMAEQPRFDGVPRMITRRVTATILARDGRVMRTAAQHAAPENLPDSFDAVCRRDLFLKVCREFYDREMNP